MGFRLVTLNVNGIRAAARKGLLPWVESAGADCIGLQEVRCGIEEVSKHFSHLDGMPGHFALGERAGYAGVALYSRKEPTDVRRGFGCGEFDPEGRWIELRYDTPQQKFSVVSAYFPSGSSSEARQEAKYRFLHQVFPMLQQMKAEREFVLVGDVNIAHKEIDLKNWRGNRDHSGFLPAERDWMTRLLDEAGLVDVFRRLNPHPDQYTWWSQRGQARAKNVGWRIDYHLATPAVAATAQREFIETRVNLSDHAPLVIEYDWRVGA